jgi:hypothetical protein
MCWEISFHKLPVNQTLHDKALIYNDFKEATSKESYFSQATVKQVNDYYRAHHGRYFLALLPTASSWQRIR